jgi:hypothetical protein
MCRQHDAMCIADKRERYIAIEHEIHNELVALAADAQVQGICGAYILVMTYCWNSLAVAAPVSWHLYAEPGPDTICNIAYTSRCSSRLSLLHACLIEAAASTLLPNDTCWRTDDCETEFSVAAVFIGASRSHRAPTYCRTLAAVASCADGAGLMLSLCCSCRRRKC